MDGEHKPDVTFEDADPPIGGLRTWPHIRHNPPNKQENMRKLTNLEACIIKELNTPEKWKQPRASSGDSYKKQGTWEHTSIDKHPHNPHIDLDAMYMKWLGDHKSTYAKRNTTHKDQCSGPNVTNLSPTHTSLEVANTTLNYAHPDITVRSSCYMDNWKNTTAGDGQ